MIGHIDWSPTYPSSSTNLGTRVCPTCKGKGVNPMWPSKVCPKCDGETRVPYLVPK